MKRCPRCGFERPDEEFAPHPETGKLQAPYCKSCRRAYAAEQRAADPEAERERQREWRRANPNKARARLYRWRKRNPEKVKAMYDRWAAKGKRNAAANKTRAANRAAVYDHYGMKCACCGESE